MNEFIVWKICSLDIVKHKISIPLETMQLLCCLSVRVVCPTIQRYEVLRQVKDLLRSVSKSITKLIKENHKLVNRIIFSDGVSFCLNGMV